MPNYLKQFREESEKRFKKKFAFRFGVLRNRVNGTECLSRNVSSKDIFAFNASEFKQFVEGYRERIEIIPKTPGNTIFIAGKRFISLDSVLSVLEDKE